MIFSLVCVKERVKEYQKKGWKRKKKGAEESKETGRKVEIFFIAKNEILI